MNLALQKQNLICAITRDLVPQIAPYEIMLFQHQRDLYLRNPEKVLRRVWGKSGDEIVFLTPILMSVLNDIVSYLCQEFQHILQEPGEDELNCAVRHVFRTFHNGDRPAGQAIKLRITETQRVTIRRLALTKALACRLSRPKARQLVDTIVDNLITTS